ncbi:MAG: MCP four helix bundle domain-containing protein, partial [Proteobacteria bacterium]|nr:MCP four helix bundle domain-containing protein [Pseudomonadota bacterium]
MSIGNLKIGVRLGGGFAFLLILLSIIVGVSYTRLIQLGEGIENVTTDRMPKIQMAGDVIENTLVIGRAVRNLIITNDKAIEKTQLEIIDKTRKANGEILDKLKPMINTPKGKEAFGKLVEARTAFGKSLDTLIPLANTSSPTHNADKATAYLFGEYSAAVAAYMDASKTFANLQRENATKTGEASMQAASAAETLLLAMAGIAFVMAVFIGWWLTRGITRPLGQAVEVANAMAVGDLSKKIEVTSKDETGQLLASMQKMTQSVQALVADAAMLSEAAVAGKLSTRADASKHQGDFNRVVVGVNQTLDAVIGPLNVAASYVDQISKGAIPAKITDSYNGDFNTLKNNLNMAIDAINALVADANSLAKAAVEGKLETRADAAKHQGDF